MFHSNEMANFMHGDGFCEGCSKRWIGKIRSPSSLHTIEDDIRLHHVGVLEIGPESQTQKTPDIVQPSIDQEGLLFPVNHVCVVKQVDDRLAFNETGLLKVKIRVGNAFPLIKGHSNGVQLLFAVGFRIGRFIQIVSNGPCFQVNDIGADKATGFGLEPLKLLPRLIVVGDESMHGREGHEHGQKPK